MFRPEWKWILVAQRFPILSGYFALSSVEKEAFAVDVDV